MAIVLAIIFGFISLIHTVHILLLKSILKKRDQDIEDYERICRTIVDGRFD